MSSTLDRLIIQPPRTRTVWLAWVIVIIMTLFFAWATLAHLQEFAMAEGEVVPQEQIQTIQHLEGGIIEKIFVQDGQRIEADASLIQLNVTSVVADKEELQVRMQALRLKKSRLEAELTGQDEFVIAEELAGYRDNLKNAEVQAFIGRRLKFQSGQALLKDQVNQKELDVKQLEAEQGSIDKNLALLREKLKISRDLIRDQLTSKLEHLQLEAEAEELQGRSQVLSVAIPRARSALQEGTERLKNEELGFRNEIQEELSAVETEISRTEEMLAKATDQVQRTTIKWPITGIVKDLKFHTIGGVVQPGQVIMEIVPETANLVVEARLDPRDIGFVKQGQRALVKIATYDYSRYGGLEGDVIDVSADAYTDEQTGKPYFKVITRTKKNHLGDSASQYPITAGMQATVDIHTGSKSVMEYILKPVLKVKNEAFRER